MADGVIPDDARNSVQSYALGRGHIDFRPVVSGMKAIGFDKTIVLECTAPGPDPFRADKGDTTTRTMAKYAKESLAKLKEWFA
jgi:D-psicose/D-tagatose/L-ribulose 3-epimerase